MTAADKPEKSARSAWINLLLVLLFSLLSLWLADLAFRAYERHFLLPQYPAIDDRAPVNLALLSYNDGVVARETAVNEFRILSFGDSFTHSIMQPDLSYNGILQQRLNAAQDEVRVRVVNLGEPGTGPNSFRAAYDFWSQVLQHDAVLFHIFLGNDIQDDAYLQSPLVWEPNIAVLQATNARLDAGSRRVPHKFPLRMLDYAWAAWLSHRTTSTADLPPGYNWAALTELEDADFLQTCFAFLDVADPAKLPVLKPGYQQLQLLLQRAQQIALRGVPVAVVLGPSEPMVNDELRAEVWQAAGADAGDFELGLAARLVSLMQQSIAPDVPLLDLTAAFRERRQSSGEKLYFRHNTHWDAAGNQLAGEVIAAFLAGRWFGRKLPVTPPQADDARGQPGASAWPGEQLLSDAQLEHYLQQLLPAAHGSLPQVRGAARSLQMFDGITADDSNWAMAELGQPIEIEFPEPQELSRLRIHLVEAGGRSYGLLLEAQLGDHSKGQWQLLADRRADPVSGLLDIKLPGTAVQALRLTGTSNSDLASNPDNHFIHIRELEWSE